MGEVLQVIGGLLALFGVFYAAIWTYYRAREGGLGRLLPWIAVHDWQRALLYRAGRFLRVAGPGRVWVLGARHHMVSVDEQMLVVETRPFVCADRRPVHVGAAVAYRVADPRRAFEYSQNLTAAFLAEATAALGDEVAARSLQRLLADRRSLGAGVFATLAPLAVARGLALDKVLIQHLSVDPEVLASVGFSDHETDAPGPSQAH